MFTRKPTITRPDRDRLIAVTRAKANTLRWAMFIDELQRELGRALIVDASSVSQDVVTMNSTIRFLDLQDHRREEYTLVYPDEADLGAGKLSVLSPLGTALLGARAGDVVTVLRAAGPRAVKIESVLYQPEAQSAAHSASNVRQELIGHDASAPDRRK